VCYLDLKFVLELDLFALPTVFVLLLSLQIVVGVGLDRIQWLNHQVIFVLVPLTELESRKL